MNNNGQVLLPFDEKENIILTPIRCLEEIINKHVPTLAFQIKQVLPKSQQELDILQLTKMSCDIENLSDEATDNFLLIIKNIKQFIDGNIDLYFKLDTTLHASLARFKNEFNKLDTIINEVMNNEKR